MASERNEPPNDPPGPIPDTARAADVVHDQIDLANADQVRDWTLALGISTEALEDAVRVVGPQYVKVREYFGNIRS